MKIYNSLSRTEEELKLDQKKVFNLYACGPTVYNYVHLGNARPNFTVDFLVRFLEFQGYQVNYLQNITDIDDKIIVKAKEEKRTEEELASFYADRYLEDMQKLNIRQPNKILKVSQSINEIVAFIQKMLDNQSAYLVNESVYFDVRKYQNEYGKLSGIKIDALESQEEDEQANQKHDQLDFALWKKTTEGLKWKTPFGAGRPGWHTECATMIDSYFNHETIDLHAGGIDLKFPHHENERIQYLAVNQKEIANTWMHNGHLTMATEKMSKSLNNFILVKDFLETNEPDLLRWLFMTTSYTQPLDITDQVFEQGKSFLKKVKNLEKKAKQLFALDELTDLSESESTNKLIEQFTNLMNDNLNLPLVLTLIEQVIKNINIGLDENKLVADWKELQTIFSALGFKNQLSHLVESEDKAMFKKWKELVVEKQFEQADLIRESLIKKGLV